MAVNMLFFPPLCNCLLYTEAADSSSLREGKPLVESESKSEEVKDPESRELPSPRILTGAEVKWKVPLGWEERSQYANKETTSVIK